MRFLKDPFAGLSGVEVCKRIYNYNRTYNEDAEEIEGVIGGQENLKTITTWDLKGSVAPFPDCKAFLVEINDYEKSSLSKRKASSIVVGGTCFIDYIAENKLVIYATGVIADGLEELKERLA